MIKKKFEIKLTRQQVKQIAKEWDSVEDNYFGAMVAQPRVRMPHYTDTDTLSIAIFCPKGAKKIENAMIAAIEIGKMQRLER